MAQFVFSSLKRERYGTVNVFDTFNYRFWWIDGSIERRDPCVFKRSIELGANKDSSSVLKGIQESLSVIKGLQASLYVLKRH